MGRVISEGGVILVGGGYSFDARSELGQTSRLGCWADTPTFQRGHWLPCESYTQSKRGRAGSLAWLSAISSSWVLVCFGEASLADPG